MMTNIDMIHLGKVVKERTGKKDALIIVDFNEMLPSSLSSLSSSVVDMIDFFRCLSFEHEIFVHVPGCSLVYQYN